MPLPIFSGAVLGDQWRVLYHNTDGNVSGYGEESGHRLPALCASVGYSESQNAFETHRPTLKVLGEDATYHGTDAGLASVYYMDLVGLSYEIWRARRW